MVATLEHATKHELPDEFVSSFRADAIWTTGGAKRLVGQPVGNQGTPLHVMAKEDGQWRLVAAQNSDVLES